MALSMAPVAGTLLLALPLGALTYLLVLALLESRSGGDLRLVRTLLTTRLRRRASGAAG